MLTNKLQEKCCPKQWLTPGKKLPKMLTNKLYLRGLCLIRCRGYYLFHHAILCGFYLRAATNRERRLLNSVLPVKSQFYKIKYDAVTWFWSKPSSFLISCRFTTKWYLHGTSNLFPRSLPMISHIDRLPNFSGQLSITAPIVYTRCMYHSIESRGLFMCARVTWILATASIREQRLPEPMVCNVQPSFPGNKTLSFQLTSVLPMTCYVAVLWPELWLQCQSDYCSWGYSGV